MSRRAPKALPTSALAVIGGLVAETAKPSARSWPKTITILGVTLHRESDQTQVAYSNDVDLDADLPLRVRGWHGHDEHGLGAYSVTINLGPWNAPRAAYFHASGNSFEEAAAKAAAVLGNTLRLITIHAGPVREVLAHVGGVS